MTTAFLSSRIFGIPFWVMLGALSLILYKEFNVSPFLITLLVALKPTSALFAAYWSIWIHTKNKNIVLYLALANLLRFTPFLFLPWIQSPWFLVGAFGWYMMLSRGCVPAWMELFKYHLPRDNHSYILSMGNAIEYLGVTLLPLSLGIILDIYPGMWRILFPLTALIGMLSTLFLIKIPPHAATCLISSRSHLARPWSQALALLKADKAFRRYQLGFMLGGAGLMILQPLLPLFLVDNLHLSYTQMMLALAVCKGVGYTLVSPIWTRLFNRYNLFTFSSLVTLLAAIFPLLLYFSQWGLASLYLAYISYGMMQAGSEMSWHLSPVTFSKDKQSIPYSETNILAVGIRGCTIPWLGALLAHHCSYGFVLMLASCCCLAGMLTLKMPKSIVDRASN